MKSQKKMPLLHYHIVDDILHHLGGNKYFAILGHGIRIGKYPWTKTQLKKQHLAAAKAIGW